KFSNPGGDATNNIFCGSGSSFVLQGSGQNDKIMEVQQSTVRFPNDLSSLEFSDGKIEMGQDRRMLAEGNSTITFDNVKITSDDEINNGHRSFVFYGQNNVTIQDCTFENGKYGLDAHNTYGGSSITISGSDFINNLTGLHVYDNAVHLDDCYFHDNIGTAVDCEAMSQNSTIYSTHIKNNGLHGINYHTSSTANLDIDNCEINGNNSYGIKTSGNFGLDLFCTYVRNNYYGIFTEFGTNVIIDNSSRNDVSGNRIAIYLNYGFLTANNGLNNFVSSNYAVKGETPLICLPGVPTDLDAENNKWDSGNNSPEFMVNHKLYVMNCDNTPVNIIDNDPSYLHCFHWVFPGIMEGGTEGNQTVDDTTQNSDLLSVSISDNQSIPIDEAVQQLSCQAEQLQSETGYQNLLDDYINLLQDMDVYTSSQVLYWKNKAWHDMHSAVNAYFAFVSHDTENAGFNQSMDDVMLLNETLMENPDVSMISYYEYGLDNALLERLRENYSQSLTMLESLKYDIPEMDREIAYINRWQCYIDAEREAKLGNISPDEFAEAIDNCNAVYEADMDEINEQDTLPGDEDSPGDTSDGTPAPNLTIIPNPNTGNFTVEVYSEVPSSGLRITNAYGQPVRNISLMDDGLQSVQVSGLAQGHYTVYYLEDGSAVASENMIVE
ncbi:MAG: right-handed parallel beta-helix repeat-containing protein, partial [Bacteroidales bacterium]